MKLRLAFLGLLILLFDACAPDEGSDTTQISGDNVAIAGDERIIAAALIAGHTLYIDVVVDGGTNKERIFPLQNINIDSTNKTISGNVSIVIEDGTHSFQLIYKLSDSNGMVNIASTPTTSRQTAADTTINIGITGTLSFDDSDQDGASNLDEIVAGTGYNDATDYPPIMSVVTSVVTSQLKIPSNLKTNCIVGPGANIPSGTCPMITYRGLRFLALSFKDDRNAFAVVAFDAVGFVKQQWLRTGDRYAYLASVDLVNKSVRFYGQSNYGVTMSWLDMQVENLLTFKPLPNTNYRLYTDYAASATVKECFDSSYYDVGLPTPGGAAHMAPCDANSAGQKWRFEEISTGYYWMRTDAHAPSQCLEANGHSASDTLSGASFMYTCSTVTGMQWTIQPGAGKKFWLVPWSYQTLNKCLQGGRSDFVDPVSGANAFMDSCSLPPVLNGQDWVFELF